MAAQGATATYIAAATAADADRVVVSANMKVGTYTIANSGTMPTGGARKITLTHTTNTATDTLGTVTIVGTDLDGVAQTEVLTPSADATVTSTNFFLTVTSATGAGWVLDTANDTLTIGCAADAACRDSDGILRRIIVGETAAGAITVADSTGTLAVLKASITEGVYEFDLGFSDYLTVTAAAASKITVVTA
jgi:hypothetical protein